MATPRYIAPLTGPAGSAASQRDIGSEITAAHESPAEGWTSSLRLSRRATQLVLDLAIVATIGLTFADTGLPAEVMFHVVFVLLTVHAFLFGLRGTLIRIAVVSLPLLGYANAQRFGWVEPAFDLTEWPLMFVIAILVAWMADRRQTTSTRYASLFRQASERLLTVEEDERRRIALELHDGVGQVLTALTLTLDAAGERGSSIPAPGLASARGLADTALAEVRHLAHQMRPARIEERGLLASIRDLAGQSGFRVRLHVDPSLSPEPPLDPTVTIGAYRIVQEALANAARHSGSLHADVWIGAHDRRLSIVIGDEGGGFDRTVSAEPGIGLAGMRERAELLGGQLTVRSAPGRGTRVSVEIPMGEPLTR